jgi:hypothetical protein
MAGLDPGHSGFAASSKTPAHREREVVFAIVSTSLRGAKRGGNPFFLVVARWIASAFAR